MRIFLLLVTVLVSPIIHAEHLALDQLLEDVKNNQGIEGKRNHARESAFISEKLKQQQRLKAAKVERKKQERISKKLKKHLEDNEKVLTVLESELRQKGGVLGELLGVARQAAGDLRVDFERSLVSSQFTGRGQQLSLIADNKALPTIAQLEQLWFLLQQEMTESGKVVHFNAEVLSAAGEAQQGMVIRIGAFNALSDGHYLRYLPESEQLAVLVRQPESQFMNLAEEFGTATTGNADLGIDPTRGVILSMLIQTPNTLERISQGGIIGYIILTLGAMGFIFALYRLYELMQTGQKMAAQLLSDTTAIDNPLGRVIKDAESHHSPDIETLELVLDEAITREVPVLEKGIGMIKLLAAVAPLLGLLGTVTGMIETFQSISLFGTGDPKLMANGISQALVTTMLGLCIAIPLLFLHSILASRSKALVQILDEQTAGIISRRAEK
ncbi:MAG: MotA/TolQ/ExbB proton channel family protein [Methylococcales bacterium]|nr:MotA/TolQ/ExbB proton channel family protein [Methylococcales bacterium]